MQVQVKNGLSGIGTIVDHQPEGIIDTKSFCDSTSDQQEVPKQLLVPVMGINQSRYFRTLGNNQYMGWSLRVNVLDHDAVIVLVQFL